MRDTPVVWSPPPDELVLPPNQVHIWCIALDHPVTHDMQRILSKHEQERAQRFVRAILSQHYIVAHSALRNILSRYLDKPPERIEFQYGPQDKPSLANVPRPLEFNLSHSDRLALAAVSWERPVGIDLERISRPVDIMGVAKNNFSAQEVAALKQVPPAQQQQAFYNAWTRKEAYLKARSLGISQQLSLKDISVSLQPAAEAQILEIVGAPEEQDRWSLYAFTPAPDFVAALAVEGHDLEQNFFTYS